MLFPTDNPRRDRSRPDIQHSLQHVTSGTGEPWDKRPGRNLESESEQERGERLRESPIFPLYGFHKGELSDCQRQSDRVFYEHLAGPRPGLCSQAVIAVPIVGLRGEERPCAIERGGARPRLPALCTVLAE